MSFPGAASTLINNGMIRGGSNLSGTVVGGVGLAIRVAGQTVVNNGAIMGGNGAVAVTTTGAGNQTLTNSGTIQAGSGQANAIQANATSTLTLELHSGSTIIGNVIAGRLGNDTLRLGGDANDVFDVSSIGSAAQYQGFEIFQKTGASIWALTGTATTPTNWSIQQGTLQIGNG